MKSQRKITLETVADYKKFLAAWSDSHANFPDAAKKKVSSSSDPIIKDYLSYVMGILLENKMINDYEVAVVGKQVTAFAMEWAILCYAVGVEGSIGNIQHDDVSLYLWVFTDLLEAYLFGFLEKIRKSHKIKHDRFLEVALGLRQYLSDTSVFLAGIGASVSLAVEPKYPDGEPSSFSQLLETINLDNARKAVSSSHGG
jgi:hypothetical protein